MNFYPLLLRPKSMHSTTFKWRLHFYAAISRILLQKKLLKNSMQHSLWTRDHCDISDSSNVITIRFYSGCSGKCITLVSTVSSLVTFKTTSLNWMSLVMRQLILVWSIFRSNPRHLMVIIQYFDYLVMLILYSWTSLSLAWSIVGSGNANVVAAAGILVQKSQLSRPTTFRHEKMKKNQRKLWVW